MGANKEDPVYSILRSAFGGTQIIHMADTKRMMVQVEQGAKLPANPDWTVIPGPNHWHLSYRGGCGRYAIFRVYDGRGVQPRVVLEETIQYQDQLRRQRLEPRVHALCNLLSRDNLPTELRVLPFYGLHDNQVSYSFGLLYDITWSAETESRTLQPKTLHELLQATNWVDRPSLEGRLEMASSLAESLAAFHDVDRYHKDLTSHSVLLLPSDATAIQYIAHPYLFGFQHSRDVEDDFSEGPLQDKTHRRYHNPRYLSMETRQFKDFRPEYDYYNFGILLMEIGLWDTIDTIMRDHANLDNYKFSQLVLPNGLAQIRFYVGSKYVAVIEQCLTGRSASHGIGIGGDIPLNAQTSLLFKETVVRPLKSLLSQFRYPEQSDVGQQKRKMDRQIDTEVVSLRKKRKS